MRALRRRVGLVLLVASVLQWAWAIPAAVSAELRAIDCCEHHCDHGPADSGACCDIAPAVGDGASLRSAAGLVPPVFVALAGSVTRLVAVEEPARDVHDRDPSPPPIPVWIRTQSLRL